MTKPRDAAHEPETSKSGEPLPEKNVDLHRYQVMTIPMELQQELASLKGPRLTDEDLKPLPPIEEVAKAHQGTSSAPPASPASARRFLAKYEFVLLAAALVFAMGWLLTLLTGRHPQNAPEAADSAPASQLPKTPLNHPAAVRQSPPPATTPSSAHTAPSARAHEEPVVKSAAPPTQSAPTHAKQSPKAAPPEKLTAVASPATESTHKPQKRAAFKPE